MVIDKWYLARGPFVREGIVIIDTSHRFVISQSTGC